MTTPNTARPHADSKPSVPIADLQRFISRVLTAVGMPGEDAATVGGIMAQADARGADAHGVFRLPAYVKRIRAGGINLHPDMRLVEERAATALLDGDNAMGHLVMKRAADLAIGKARRAGIGWVGTRHSNHAGPAGLYARMPLEHGMIGIYMAVGSANHMPPWGGIDMLLSTNPIAIAVPAANRPPIVLDMATTTAAYGKVKALAQRGQAMPEGWMVGRDGKPLLDPKRSDEGFLLPIGGPKGYGLALMFGILAGALNGAAFGRDVVDFNKDYKSVTNTGQAVAAIDVTAFMPMAQFEACIDDIWTQMKSSELLPGVEEIRLPGEQSAITYEDRVANGVPLHPELIAALDALALDVGVHALL
ncbi:Ldh family oxidoreductase [Achromobacter aloeverae]|uniref:Lactate dehydrogenase n=1 Tax=Achromobacter aloeverae TaxID=1750518 RepID=A0A4V1MS84_9BURK|nr:Ldh family oxidoreductase [Achromobacter aloeverae]RXN90422.1 lactate dehydrogenase [Achromobacter aloeverae]